VPKKIPQRAKALAGDFSKNIMQILDLKVKSYKNLGRIS